VIGGVGLGSCDGAESDEHCWVNGNAVVQERTDDLLEAGHLGFVERRASVEIGCVLDFGAVGRLIPFVGCTAGWRVCSNIVGHRNVNILLGVVPFYGEATIKFTFPGGGDDVKILKGFDEVVGIVFADVLDAKVVDNEAEGDVAARVTPEAGGSRRGGVAVFGKVGGETNVGNEAGLFEVVHALAKFHVHPPVGGGEGLQRVLLYNFVGNDVEGKSHVFVPFH
jgi:hypothetical protein